MHCFYFILYFGVNVWIDGGWDALQVWKHTRNANEHWIPISHNLYHVRKRTFLFRFIFFIRFHMLFCQLYGKKICTKTHKNCIVKWRVAPSSQKKLHFFSSSILRSHLNACINWLFLRSWKRNRIARRSICSLTCGTIFARILNYL